MKKLYILDASGYLYRAYFAIRQMTNSKGESTNALFGFIRSLLRLRKDFNPDYMVAVFDGPRNAHKRLQVYPHYKAHRSDMPGDLLYQMAWARTFCELAGIPMLDVAEVEADDTMGTVAKWAEGQGAEVFLCTTDKDMCQLVNDRIKMLNTYKDNQILGIEEVEAQFGVSPKQMIDFLSLTGDASDNVPGVPGFGAKTAAELLRHFGTLDYLLSHPEEVPGKQKQKALQEHREDALMSRFLVTVDTAVPIPKEEEFYKIAPYNIPALKEFYAGMDFHSLTRELEQTTGCQQQEQDVAYQVVDDEQALLTLIEELKQQKEICFDTEATNELPMKAELVGIGLGYTPKQAWYVPVNGNLGLEKVIGLLKPLFESPHIGFYGHNVKYDCHVLETYGIRVASIIFDTMLGSYVLNSHRRQHSLDYLALECFEKVKASSSALVGKGKKQISMYHVPIEKIAVCCCESVDYTVRLKALLEKGLEERQLMPLFKDLELPLLSVLAKMERQGIYLDTPYLAHFSQEVSSRIADFEEEIYQMAGEQFNLNSPKQLSEILFVKMGIKPPKKTATGLSTDADTLESLQYDYPIAGKILEYRVLEKLRSTYVDVLPLEVNPKTQRVHCTFNQSVAATGRLSCQDPNLQNIPIRSEMGRRLREAFRPQQEGWSFLAADYSQIELRLLAHLSGDPVMIKAFNNQEDIHAATAAEVLGIPISQVSKEERARAKAVNFGVIYGQQAFGLARGLGIDVKEAAFFIEQYFQRYKKVKEFIEACKEFTRRHGKSVTLMGRERVIPDIHSKNAQIRSAAERLAVNTPLQGLAADLIKTAMIRIDQRLDERRLKGFMALQIHDELIFEVPDDEIAVMEKLVREAMEGVLSLNVPLVVDIIIGRNWKEC